MSGKRKRGLQPMATTEVVAKALVEVVAEPGAETGASAGEVGRLVDSSQADDRRMIRLVRERPPLYARNNMPIASYYAQVKKLWQEVADEMGWTVADVRRKWSHVRNSYSRHLRNEMYGVRTGRGRIVSKWYLADELGFLREHMATDTRPPARYSAYPSLYQLDMSDHDHADSAEPVDFKPFLSSPWLSALAGQPKSEPDSLAEMQESASPRSFEPDENSGYFQFFRGIYNDYQELPGTKQRLFRRECLAFLHRLLDDEDAQHQRGAINLSNSAHVSDDERDVKPALLTVEHDPLPR